MMTGNKPTINDLKKMRDENSEQIVSDVTPKTKKRSEEMTSPFAAPSSLEGSSVKPADIAGHLLIIKPVEYKTGILTSLGEAEAIEVDLIDLDTNTEHKSVLFFNVALRNALKSNIGQQVLARIGQGVAKPGKSAPWILINATDDANAVAKATAYLAGSLKGAAAPKDENVVAMTPEIQELINKLGAKPL